MAYIAKRPDGKQIRDEPDYRALAQICKRHKDGDCLAAMERLASQLRLTSRERIRLRHILKLHSKPYVSS